MLEIYSKEEEQLASRQKHRVFKLIFNGKHVLEMPGRRQTPSTHGPC